MSKNVSQDMEANNDEFEITLNDLENHLSSIQDSHYVDIFLNDFFEIGFTKSSYEVLDQNYQDNNIQINFTYDDLYKT